RQVLHAGAAGVDVADRAAALRAARWHAVNTVNSNMCSQRTLFTLLAGGLFVAAATLTHAQIVKPKLELTPVVEPASAHAGGSVKATLKVHLPENVHVQSDKPRDPSLIPTVLKIDAPAGVTVGKITFPAPRDLTQAGQSQPLAVFGPDFTISV